MFYPLPFDIAIAGWIHGINGIAFLLMLVLMWLVMRLGLRLAIMICWNQRGMQANILSLIRSIHMDLLSICASRDRSVPCPWMGRWKPANLISLNIPIIESVSLMKWNFTLVIWLIALFNVIPITCSSLALLASPVVRDIFSAFAGAFFP